MFSKQHHITSLHGTQMPLRKLSSIYSNIKELNLRSMIRNTKFHLNIKTSATASGFLKSPRHLQLQVMQNIAWNSRKGQVTDLASTSNTRLSWKSSRSKWSMSLTNKRTIEKIILRVSVYNNLNFNQI